MTLLDLLLVATLEFKNSMFVIYNYHRYHIDETKSEWMDFEVRKYIVERTQVQCELKRLYMYERGHSLMSRKRRGMDKSEEFRELYLLIGTGNITVTAIQAGNTAKMIQDAGYRKADEVRKEKATEIFNELLNYCCIDIKTLKLLAKKHGVEVDE